MPSNPVTEAPLAVPPGPGRGTMTTRARPMPPMTQTRFDMDSNQFEQVVHAAMEQLPDWVRKALHNIDVLVVDDPGEVADAAGEELLGLYVGLPLTEREANYHGELPDVIYIFRRPHLSLGLPVPELQDEIAKTLIHEIAHYFGIDDDHLDEIGWG